MKKKLIYSFDPDLKGDPIELTPVKIKATDISIQENGFDITNNKIKGIKVVKDKSGRAHFVITLKKNIVLNEPLTITYTQLVK